MIGPMMAMCRPTPREKTLSPRRVGRPAHGVPLRRLHPHAEAEQAVREQVAHQDLDRLQHRHQADEGRGGHHDDLRHVARDREHDEAAQVVVDHAPFLHRRHDGGEVVVEQHHVCRLLRDVGAGDPHGHADVRPLERRCVVHAVAGHGHDVPSPWSAADDPQLVLGRDAREAVGVGVRALPQVGVGHALQLDPGDDVALGRRSIPRSAAM